MLRVLLVTTRQKSILSFIEGLSSDSAVYLDQVASRAEALGAVRFDSPHLVIIDSYGMPDKDSLSLVRELLMVNAMINCAVVSSLSDKEFHDASEGLGVLASLPITPDEKNAAELLSKLRDILGLHS